MKVNYVKLGFLVLLFICLYSFVVVGNSEVVWSEDFDDGDYDGWPAGFGEWAIINGTLQGQEPSPDRPYCLLKKPSTLAYGTWSFDVNLKKGKSLSIAFINNNETFSTYGHWYELDLLPRTGSTVFSFVKVGGAYSDTKEIFTYYTTEEELHDTWHHIDITRELDGRFSFYLDAEFLFDIFDNNIVTSEEFAITSHPDGAFIDNIEVSDEIRIWSDDFDDGDFDGWTVVYGNWTVTNNSLQALASRYTYNQGGFITHPSSIAFGTWSLDIKIRKGKTMALFPISTNHTHYYNGHLYYLDLYPGTQLILGFAQLDGIYPENGTGLADAVVDYSPERWYHLDITRDIDGRFCVYINGILIIDVVDSSVDYSEDFDIASFPTGCLVDNITVIDIVKDPLNVSVDIIEELVTQGDDVLVEIENVERASVVVSIDDQVLDVTVEPDGVYRAVVETSNYLGTVELVVSAEKFGFISLESIYRIEVVAPASFVTSGLSIEPSSVLIGETVVISGQVSNFGGQEGSQNTVLSIQGVPVDVFEVTLESGGSETVTFEYVPIQSGTFTVYMDDLTETLTVVEPASFEVSNLAIVPESIMEGESVTLSVECSNVGGISGSFDVVLKIDEVIEDTSTVTLDAAESTNVSFDISATQEGPYSVEIGGLTGSFTVNPQEPKPKPGGIPGFTIETVFMGIILGAIILWISRR